MFQMQLRLRDECGCALRAGDIQSTIDPPIGPFARALQICCACCNEIMSRWCLCLARGSGNSFFGRRPIAFRHLQQTLRQTATCAFLSTLESRFTPKTPSPQGLQSESKQEVRGNKCQHESDGGHLDQISRESNRDIAGIREQKRSEQRAADHRERDIESGLHDRELRVGCSRCKLESDPEMSGKLGSMSTGSRFATSLAS